MKRIAGALFGALLLASAAHAPARAQSLVCINGFLFSGGVFNLGIACGNPVDLDFLRRTLLKVIAFGNDFERRFGRPLPPPDQLITLGTEFVAQHADFFNDYDRFVRETQQLQEAMNGAGVNSPFGSDNQQKIDERLNQLDQEMAEQLRQMQLQQQLQQRLEQERDRLSAATQDQRNQLNAQNEQFNDQIIRRQIDIENIQRGRSTSFVDDSQGNRQQLLAQLERELQGLQNQQAPVVQQLQQINGPINELNQQINTVSTGTNNSALQLQNLFGQSQTLTALQGTR